MLYIVTGGSGSGKSEFAEKLTLSLKSEDEINAGIDAGTDSGLGGKLWYVATMKPLAHDEEMDKKILRHQNMRAGKGFDTVECYENIGQLQFCGADTVLMECMSNLLANEMYGAKGCLAGINFSFDNASESARELVKKHIVKPIVSISRQVKNLVVVTNEVFNDGRNFEYDSETRLYIELLGYINQELVAASYGFVEVFCGIPLWQKGERIDV